jgi:hypothetical protein
MLSKKLNNEFFKPDFFLKRQLLYAESMRLQPRRIKLDYRYLIDLDFKINETSVSIGLLLHEMHLREMKSFVDGYRENASKMEGVKAFFDKYDIGDEYDFESAYRYIKKNTNKKTIEKSEQIPVSLFPIKSEHFTPNDLLDKIAAFFNCPSDFYKNVGKARKQQYIAGISYYLLYEYALMNQIDIAKKFGKARSRICEALNKTRQMVYTDHSINNDIAKILDLEL